MKTSHQTETCPHCGADTLMTLWQIVFSGKAHCPACGEDLKKRDKE